MPVKHTALFKVIHEHEEGKIVRDGWNQKGRTRLLQDEDIEELKNNLTKYTGKTIAYAEIRKKIQEKQISIAKRHGKVPLTKCTYEPSNQTLDNYFAV